jgi:hypothetical protein
VTLEAHEVAHDLPVRLPVEPVALGADAAEHLTERAMDRAAAGPVGPEDRAVDVEEDERAGGGRGAAQRTLPAGVGPRAPMMRGAYGR